jgi:hypothetical protein
VRQASELKPRPIFKSEKPARDPKYLAFLRKLPCIVCGSYRFIEAAHFGARGLGQKASDHDALPLCVNCHRIGPKSYHVLGARRFLEYRKLDPKPYQEKILEFYKEKIAA